MRLRVGLGGFFYDEPEFGSVSGRRRVRSLGRWYVRVTDWTVIDGCDFGNTDPAIYRASLVTGKSRLIQTGVTCDGEEYW